MNSKRMISWITLLLGEAIIISAFILFRGETSDNILVQNIVVTTIIYCLFFIDILIPWIDIHSKSQNKTGSLGIRWFFTWMYSVFAIASMAISNTVYHLSFETQLIIHGTLLLLLLVGFVVISQTTEKINDVFNEERVYQLGIGEMKIALNKLKDRMSETSGLPEYFVNQVNGFEEKTKFLSPSNHEEAYILEQQITEIINTISFAINDFSLNEESIERNLKKCESIYQKRKQIYSL